MKQKRVVIAKRARVAKMDRENALAFLKKHHKQGLACPGKGLEAYGLLAPDGEVLGVAIFCNPRTSEMQRRYTTELFTLAFKEDVRVPGGASKLIKTFLRERNPFALFTYHDAGGTNTDVYLHAGLTLVEEAKPKKVLVRDGLTLEEAANNLKDWISLEQASRLGPDALLGTTMGEVYRLDGRRKSNIDLFVDHCGYHLEERPGDAVYEWINPDLTYYLYRITSTRGDGYYIGRHVLKHGGATLEECLKDPYMGSGGRRFQTWCDEVGRDSLVKEILEIHSSWQKIVEAERRAIGDRHLTDPSCKNFLPGGVGLGRSVNNIRRARCSTHGETLFNGTSCVKCSVAKGFSLKHCSTHGEATFRGDACIRCQQPKRYTQEECSKHGEGSFRDGLCLRCLADKAMRTRLCPLHGLTIHQGATCGRCNAEGSVLLQECPTHGLVKHQGGKCCTCSSQATVTLQECPTHGETKFQGDHCMRCNSRRQLQERKCPTHGKTLHKGASCTLCTVEKALHEGECPVHGRVKFQGTVCTRCNAQKSVTMRECPTHGLTKHQGLTCNRCNAQRSVRKGRCEVHGEVKFQGGKCVTCRNAALITVKDCPVHGPSKHRGKSCYACMADRRRERTAAKG